MNMYFIHIFGFNYLSNNKQWKKMRAAVSKCFSFYEISQSIDGFFVRLLSPGYRLMCFNWELARYEDSNRFYCLQSNQISFFFPKLFYYLRRKKSSWLLKRMDWIDVKRKRVHSHSWIYLKYNTRLRAS